MYIYNIIAVKSFQKELYIIKNSCHPQQVAAGYTRDVGRMRKEKSQNTPMSSSFKNTHHIRRSLKTKTKPFEGALSKIEYNVRFSDKHNKASLFYLSKTQNFEETRNDFDTRNRNSITWCTPRKLP